MYYEIGTIVDKWPRYIFLKTFIFFPLIFPVYIEKLFTKDSQY